MNKKRNLMERSGKLYVLLLLIMLMSITTIVAQNNYVEKDVWINNGSRRIYGVLASPKSNNIKYPLIIIAHGFNGNHCFARNYFNRLCALGYACYSFDFPCGSLDNRSDINTMNMSVMDEVSDVKAVIRYFKEVPYIDSTQIVLLGESQGGLVSALAAADVPNDVTKLVLVYPAFCIPDNWITRYKKISDIPDTTYVWGVPLGRRFFEEVRKIDAYGVMERYKGEVLIVHGDKDSIVPLDYSKRALEKYPNAQMKVINGAGHGFKNEHLDEFLSYLTSFLMR